MKFKLSRKRKKQYKKDLGYNSDILFSLYKQKEYWEWFYFRKSGDFNSCDFRCKIEASYAGKK